MSVAAGQADQGIRRRQAMVGMMPQMVNAVGTGAGRTVRLGVIGRHRGGAGHPPSTTNTSSPDSSSLRRHPTIRSTTMRLLRHRSSSTLVPLGGQRVPLTMGIPTVAHRRRLIITTIHRRLRRQVPMVDIIILSTNPVL